jgi:hypothetical protein
MCYLSKFVGNTLYGNYLVTAKLKRELFKELKDSLNRDLFYNLKPFGHALTFSLKNAKIQEDCLITWEEEDYCVPPLKEERENVLERFFDNIKVERVSKGEGWEKIKYLPSLFNNSDF